MRVRGNLHRNFWGRCYFPMKEKKLFLFSMYHLDTWDYGMKMYLELWQLREGRKWWTWGICMERRTDWHKAGSGDQKWWRCGSYVEMGSDEHVVATWRWDVMNMKQLSGEEKWLMWGSHVERRDDEHEAAMWRWEVIDMRQPCGDEKWWARGSHVETRSDWLTSGSHVEMGNV